MTAEVEEYSDGVERFLLLLPVVLSFSVREREERLQEGFIRIRAAHSNGDLLEAFEFVVAKPHGILTLTYRIHWQGREGDLKRRWDNARHYGGIPNFPHHVHLGPGGEVGPSEPMTIVKALALIESEIQPDVGSPQAEA
jgi:hypothetical protein